MPSPSDRQESGNVSSSPEGAMLNWIKEIAPYGILTTDRELRIHSWNEWLAGASGLDSGEVLGRSLFEVFPELKSRRLDETYQRALAGEVCVLSAALHRYLLPIPPTVRDGGYFHMQQTARIAPLVAGGAIIGTITIIEDVTQREAHAATLRRQHDHDLLLSSALGHLLKSTEPIAAIAELFPRIATALELDFYSHYILGQEAPTLNLAACGTKVTPDVLPASIHVGEGLCGRSAHERSPVIIQRIQASDDEGTRLAKQLGLRAFAAFPLLVGEQLLGTVAFATSARDVITRPELDFLSTLAQYFAIALERGRREVALQDAQDALSRHAGTLEAKIAERTAALNETIAQLESFSYTVAHDLRAPIRSLMGYSEILLAEYSEQMPADARFILHKLSRAGCRLDALTRDLLRFSRVSRDDFELQTVDLDALVAEMILLTPSLQGNVLVVQRPLGRVWAQRTLIEQCFANLFENALKFTRPGVAPRIDVQSEHNAVPDASPVDIPPASIGSTPPMAVAIGPWIRVTISDNGIGIAAEAQRKIFGMFERGTGAEKIEGTGIGLAIVDRATRRMGGRCGVHSTLGNGSRFWLELVSADGPRPVTTNLKRG
ncbi:MAG TPA: ATP-binding protein [Opitutaceae bacterium]|nr:ATP-binding protein [Opitutaceae bacterium]